MLHCLWTFVAHHPQFLSPFVSCNLSNAGIQASKIYTSMTENGTRSSKKLTLGTQDYCPPNEESLSGNINHKFYVFSRVNHIAFEFFRCYF